MAKIQKEDNITTLKGKTKSYNLDDISFYLIFFLAFLLPIFFLPLFNISVDVWKSVLLSTFTAIAFFLWLIARLKDGTFIFPKSIVLLSGAVIPVVFLLSSIFSKIPSVSFVGLGYEIGTLSSIVLLFIVLFLSSVFFQLKKRLFKLYSAIFLSAFIAFAYQLVNFIFLNFSLPFAHLFKSLPYNLVGKWTDFAIFFGLILILSLIALELLSLNKKTKILLRFALVISTLVLILVNFHLLWLVVGFFSLVIFVYTISFGSGNNQELKERKIPKASFSILLISLFFVLASGLVSDVIYSYLRIPQEILRPTWSQTLTVVKDTLSVNPIFGSGPNRFSNNWLLFKPAEVNNSIIWNADFNAGVGLIPSFMATTGIVGIIAWLVFFLAFLYHGVKSVFLTQMKITDNFPLFSSFLAALYLWVFSIFYVPNITIFFLLFLMTGVFIASSAGIKFIKNYNFSFLKDPRIGFTSVMVLILSIMFSLSGGYILLQKFLSVGYFQKSVSAFTVDGNLDAAEKNIIRAIKLNKNDFYYRTLTEMNIARLRSILSQSGISKETIRAQFQSVYQAAIKNALTATELDGTNYLNWISLARVYESLMPFSAQEQFYKNAKMAYEKALSFNPKSPAIVLMQARLEVAAGNTDRAKEYIAQALNQKNNYTEAIFLLSQIQAKEGNLDDAIASAEAASLVSPNNIGVFFQLGLLRYNNKDYNGAISAFKRALELNPNYSNAKYFLGLSYSKTGERSKAIKQFEEIKALNPGNVEVKNILRNLKKKGRAFSGSESEDVKNLPIKE
jgi:tetratricopeptide (TPR) repeat protein